MIKSIPVIVSKVRILRPSRPIIRPFISSFGNGTTEIVVSATWSAAHFWIAVTTYSFAFLFASSFALFSRSLTNIAVSCFTSSSTVLKRYSFACSEVKPEILSSSCTLFWFSSFTSASCLFNLSSRDANWFSLRSRESALRSTASSLESTRFSYFCNSFLRSLLSFSSSFLFLKASSLTSRRPSRFFVSAVFMASSIISRAFSSAEPILDSTTFFL